MSVTFFTSPINTTAQEFSICEAAPGGAVYQAACVVCGRGISETDIG
jgi:hypothetical protein